MRVAVVIPTFNRREFVGDAVRSALNQSVPADVVVVDDGSTDGTYDALARWFGDRIILVRQENLERGAARNRGAREVPEAELLCFLDSDDVLLPHHVEVLVRGASAHPGASFISTRARACAPDLTPQRLLTRQRPGPVRLESFLRGRCVLPPSAVAFRRVAYDSVGGFDEARDLAGSEDWLLVARILARGDGHQMDDETVLLRKHSGNTMANAAGMERSMLLAHDRMFGRYAAELEVEGSGVEGSRSLRARSRATLLIHAAATHFGEGSGREARRCLAAAWSESPIQCIRDLRVPRIWMRSWLRE